MPTVRTYGATQVATRPLPDTSRTDVRSPESFGAGVGRQVAGIGLELLRTAITQERNRADELAILEASTQLSSWESERLYAPEGGALNVQGKDSFGLPEQLLGEFDQVKGKILLGLTTPRQKIEFLKDVAVRRRNVDLTLRRHVADQMQKFDVDQTEAYLKNAAAAAIQNVGDLRRVGEELGRGIAAIEQHSARTGAPADVTAQTVLAFRSAVHAGVIDRMLAGGNDRAATIYFEEVQAQLDGAAIIRLEKALETGSLLGESQRTSDAIVTSSSTLTEALEHVRAITDPKLRAEVRPQVEHEFALRATAAAAARRELHVRIADLIDKTGSTRGVNPGEWSTLTADERQSFIRFAQSKAERRTVETDMARWLDLRRLAATDPQRFAQMSLITERHRISEGDLKQLGNLQAAILGDKPGGADVVRAATIDQTLFDSIARSAGLPVGSAATVDKARLGEVENTALKEIDLAQQREKRALYRDEKEAIMRRIVDQKVLLNSWGVDPSVPAASVVSPADRERAYVPVAQIPPVSLTEFVNVLRSQSPRAATLSTEEITRRFRSQLERAYAALLINLGDAEVLRRLRGE